MTNGIVCIKLIVNGPLGTTEGTRSTCLTGLKKVRIYCLTVELVFCKYRKDVFTLGHIYRRYTKNLIVYLGLESLLKNFHVIVYAPLKRNGKLNQN